jgi:hypothetical protein
MDRGSSMTHLTRGVDQQKPARAAGQKTQMDSLFQKTGKLLMKLAIICWLTKATTTLLRLVATLIFGILKKLGLKIEDGDAAS